MTSGPYLGNSISFITNKHSTTPSINDAHTILPSEATQIYYWNSHICTSGNQPQPSLSPGHGGNHSKHDYRSHVRLPRWYRCCC